MSRFSVPMFLTPTLKPGNVVTLDNLGSCKGSAVRKAIRDVGARLVFLPAAIWRALGDENHQALDI
jgi:hypothetical protein